MQRLVVATAFSLVALLVACGGGSNDAATSPPAATPLPTTPTGASTPGTSAPPTPGAYRGGIESVDRAIAAVEANDDDALIELMRYTQMVCEATPEPLSIPPYCDGEPEGSLVPAFPTASCEGAYHRPGTAEESVRSHLDRRNDARLYGVYRIAGSRAAEGFFSHAQPVYAIVFAATYDDGLEHGWALFADNEGIVGISGGCGETVENYVAFWELSDAITGP